MLVPWQPLAERTSVLFFGKLIAKFASYTTQITHEQKVQVSPIRAPVGLSPDFDTTFGRSLNFFLEVGNYTLRKFWMSRKLSLTTRTWSGGEQNVLKRVECPEDILFLERKLTCLETYGL